MLGFSLPSRLFRTDHGANINDALLQAFDNRIEKLLTALKEAGITSIEIRMLPRNVDSTLYRDVIQMIWEAGLQLTVHGGLEGEGTGESFADMYPSLDYILAHFRKYQAGLTITVHALHDREAPDKDMESVTRDLSQRTTARLKEWAVRLNAEKSPIQLALEINRHKRPVIDPGCDCTGVVQMATGTDCPNVGICWDMGHYYSNLVTQSGSGGVPAEWLEELPPAAFLDRVVHTHIHGLFGRTGTHFPLTSRSSLPLELYVRALRESGYQGVFNLELTWDKWARETVREQTMDTIHRLREAIR